MIYDMLLGQVISVSPEGSPALSQLWVNIQIIIISLYVSQTARGTKYPGSWCWGTYNKAK